MKQPQRIKEGISKLTPEHTMAQVAGTETAASAAPTGLVVRPAEYMQTQCWVACLRVGLDTDPHRLGRGNGVICGVQ